MGQWNDDTYKTFSDLGFTGQLHDMIAAHYREAGYTGSLSDMAAAVRAELGVTDLFPVAFTTTNFITVASDGSVTTLFNNMATTDLNIKDHEGIYRTVPAGVVPFQGARSVQNLAASPASPSTQDITVVSGHTYQISIGSGSASGATVVCSNAFTGTLTGDATNRLTFTAAKTAGSTTLTLTITGSIANLLVEDTTGRTDVDTPSEYTADFKVFATANGNSVDGSGVVTETVGAALSPVPSIFYTPAATNDLTYSRDLTNWTQSGTSVSAYDAVGLAGEANTATTLTDDNAGGYEYVTAPYYSYSAGDNLVIKYYVKKSATDTRPMFGVIGYTNPRLGEFFVNLKTGYTWDRAGSEPDAVEVISSGDWWIILASLTVNTTSSSGARVFPGGATADDGALTTAATGSCVVGNVELYKNKTIAEVRALGPIFTTTAAASTDRTVLRTDDLSWFSQDKGAFYFEWTPQYATAEVSGDLSILDLANAAGLAYYDGANGDVESTDGTNTCAKSQTLVSGTKYKVGIAYDTSANKIGISINGSAYTETSYDGSYAATSNLLELFYSHGYVNTLEVLKYTQRAYAAGQSWIDGEMST